MDMHLLTSDITTVDQWRARRTETAGADAERRVGLLQDRAKEIRRDLITMIGAAKQGHVGGDLSVTDILTVLYHHVLRIDPANPTAAVRDRFILSKGHCAAAFYATLASAGYIPHAALESFMKPLSELSGHPNRTKVPGVETNTGPLGHGLPVAVGEAIAARLKGTDERVFVALGDGEMQEGSNWEALMLAGHRKLANLTVIVDRNRLQQGARTEETNALDPLDDKLAAFGLEVRVIDGHDIAALIEAFGPSTTGKPVGVIANTIKGKGVSFIEDRVEWHHKVPSAEQVAQAMEELA